MNLTMVLGSLRSQRSLVVAWLHGCMDAWLHGVMSFLCAALELPSRARDVQYYTGVL